MVIPTEPIGSIPPTPMLREAPATRDGADPALEAPYDAAVRDTIRRIEATESPVVTEGEQPKSPNFWTNSVHGLPNMNPSGFRIPFASGHARRMPRLIGGPYRCVRRAEAHLQEALRHASVPVKQEVISPSALSPLYPAEEIPGYPRERFLEDPLREHEAEVRTCLARGAPCVRVDFTEGRLAVEMDPTGPMLRSFIDLNNLALGRFAEEGRGRIGVHTCPVSDRGSTHGGDVDSAELLPSPVGHLGTSDDCGFAPFCDDASTTREVAIAKIRSRSLGTAMAAEVRGSA